MAVAFYPNLPISIKIYPNPLTEISPNPHVLTKFTYPNLPRSTFYLLICIKIKTVFIRLLIIQLLYNKDLIINPYRAKRDFSSIWKQHRSRSVGFWRVYHHHQVVRRRTRRRHCQSVLLLMHMTNSSGLAAPASFIRSIKIYRIIVYFDIVPITLHRRKVCNIFSYCILWYCIL